MFYKMSSPKIKRLAKGSVEKNLAAQPQVSLPKNEGILDPAPLMAAFHSHQLVTAREKVSRMEGLTWKI